MSGAIRRSREENLRRPSTINHSTRDQLKLNGNLMDPSHQFTTGRSHILSLKRETGATPESRELTGATRRRPRTSTREPRDNKDSCSFKSKRRTGAIEASTPTNGVIRKSREVNPRRPLTINLFTKDQPRLSGNSMDPNHQSTTGKSHTLLLSRERETGATVESREPTGAIKKSRRILTREPRDNRALCSCKSRRRTGVTEVSTPMNGAIKKLREENLRRLLTINHSMRDQPRPNGNSTDPNHQSTTGRSHTPCPSNTTDTTCQLPTLKSKTGATVASRAPTGATKRRPLT